MLILIPAFALKVSKQEAGQIGSDFLLYLGANPESGMQIESYSAESELADIYIINSASQGFVILAADDRAVPILAYSTSSNISLADLPPQLEWYFAEYSEAFGQIRAHPAAKKHPAWQELRQRNFVSYQVQRSVSPLLSTTWNQGYPYNYLCPEDPDGPGDRVWAGCVATAMAQVMKYWNHPIQGTGSHEYNASGYGTQSAYFGETTYNWAEMPNSISSVNYNIATLIYHCGVAVEMDYSPQGSGAYTSDARIALIDYFKYSNDASYQYKVFYTDSDWSSLLRADLDAGRPIIYRGQGDGGGHAWVCDGYQNADYFHFNWGWSGSGNGYFYLNNLNPNSQNFTSNQQAILNLYPQGEGNLQGTIFTNGVALAGATVSLDDQEVITSSTGSYAFNSLSCGLHQISAAKMGFETVSQAVEIVADQTITLDIVLDEWLFSPSELIATRSEDVVNLSWQEAGSTPDPEWLSWSDETHYTSVGINPAGTFQVAQRWDQSDLSGFDNGQISQVQFYPCYQDCEYTIKIWVGGNASDPGTLAYSQPVTTFQNNTWNTVSINTPVTIPAYGDLWVGYAADTQGGYPAGVDNGPAVIGKGNMVNLGGGWAPLTNANPSMNYNWLIKALVSYPRRAELISLSESSSASLNNRDLNGYHLFRLNPDQEDDPSLWTQLTDSPIVENSASDDDFAALPSGTYKWAVTAVYTAGALSDPAFSNPIVKESMIPLAPELTISINANNAILNWEHVTDASGSSISGIQYQVYRHDNPDIPTSATHLIATTANNYFVDTNTLQDQARYFYKVIAISP